MRVRAEVESGEYRQTDGDLLRKIFKIKRDGRCPRQIINNPNALGLTSRFHFVPKISVKRPQKEDTKKKNI